MSKVFHVKRQEFEIELEMGGKSIPLTVCSLTTAEKEQMVEGVNYKTQLEIEEQAVRLMLATNKQKEVDAAIEYIKTNGDIMEFSAFLHKQLKEIRAGK